MVQNIKIKPKKSITAAIYYTINRKNSRYISDLIGSTDSKIIKTAFNRLGLNTPLTDLKTPGDRSKIVDTLLYSLKNGKIKKKKYHFVCLLQPTFEKK